MDHKFKLLRVTQVNIGDMIYYEEDVFIRENGAYVFTGKRCTVVEVVSKGVPGEAICKVMKSAGVNADPIGCTIGKPIANLLRGYSLNTIDFNNELLKKGGHLEGVQNGKKIALTDASKGGMSVGAKHTEDGIKGVVGTQERPIEFEGEEIILTAPLSSNPEKYEFEGTQLTGKEIASKLNQDNGGVSFADGGEASSCRCSGKTYKFGGQTITDKDIINYINFMNKNVQDRILYLKK